MFEPNPTPGERGLPTPDVDTPPRMEIGRAFQLGRAIGDGISAVKRAPIPLGIGAFVLGITDGGYNFNLPGGDGGDPPDTDFDFEGFEGFEGFGRGLEEGSDTAFAFGERLADAAGVPALQALDPGALIALGLVGAICVLALVLFMLALRAFVFTGYVRLQSHVLQTAEQTAFGPLFSGADRFVDMLLWQLLAGVVGFGAFFVSGLPGGALLIFGVLRENLGMAFAGGALMLVLVLPVLTYVSLGLVFGPYAVVLDGLSPLDALRRSWMLARGHRFHLLLFFLVLLLFRSVVGLAGLLLCCVGVLLTIPLARAVTEVAVTESYLLFSRGREVTAYWELWRLKDAGVL